MRCDIERMEVIEGALEIFFGEGGAKEIQPRSTHDELLPKKAIITEDNGSDEEGNENDDENEDNEDDEDSANDDEVDFLNMSLS